MFNAKAQRSKAAKKGKNFASPRFCVYALKGKTFSAG